MNLHAHDIVKHILAQVRPFNHAIHKKNNPLSLRYRLVLPKRRQAKFLHRLPSGLNLPSGIARSRDFPSSPIAWQSP